MVKGTNKEKPRKKGESESEPELSIDDEQPVPKITTTKSPKKAEKKSDLEKVISLNELDDILTMLIMGRTPRVDIITTLLQTPLNEVNRKLIKKEENTLVTHPHFQTVDKKKDRLNAAVNGIFHSDSKDWQTMATKVTEVYKMAADLAYVLWGKNAKKERVMKTAHADPDWSGKPMMELTYQLLNGTCGLDWQTIRDSRQIIQQVQGDLGRIREEFRITVGNEFSQQFGSTLGDFATQWAKLATDLDDIRSAIANITTCTNKPQVLHISKLKKESNLTSN